MLRSNKGDWSGSIEQAIEAVFQDCQYVQAAHQRGTLQLSVQRGKLRFRFTQSDGAVLHTSHISDRKKIASQLADFLQTTSDAFPRQFKFADYGKVQFDFEAEFQRQEAERLKQEALERKRARVRAALRVAAVAAPIILLATIAFGALFKKVGIHQSAHDAEIIALRSPAELSGLLKSSKFSLEFSNLLISTETRIRAADLKESESLAKQREFIAARDAQISDMSSRSTKELVDKYSTVAPEKFAELTNVLYSVELLEKIFSGYSPPARSSERVPRTFLSAGSVAEIGGMSKSDALRWKWNLPSRSDVEAEQRHNEWAKELEQLRPKARQLESDVRAVVRASFSSACDLKTESLRNHEFSEVENLRASVQHDIREFDRTLLAESTNHLWVLPIPFSQAVFAARRSQILIIVSANALTNSQVVFCGAEQHRELLFDFLKQEFSYGR